MQLPVVTKPERKVPLTQRLQQPHSLQYCIVVLTDFELLVIQLFALCTTDCPNHMDCIVACSMTSWIPKLCRIPGLGWHLAPHKQTYPFCSPLGIFSSKVSGSCDLLRSPVPPSPQVSLDQLFLPLSMWIDRVWTWGLPRPAGTGHLAVPFKVSYICLPPKLKRVFVSSGSWLTLTISLGDVISDAFPAFWTRKPKLREEVTAQKSHYHNCWNSTLEPSCFIVLFSGRWKANICASNDFFYLILSLHSEMY